MSKKHSCPKCNGQGYIIKRPDDVDRHFRRITMPYKIRCSFCNGKGWIDSDEEAIKGAVSGATLGFVLLGPPGLIIGGLAGSLLGKILGR